MSEVCACCRGASMLAAPRHAQNRVVVLSCTLSAALPPWISEYLESLLHVPRMEQKSQCQTGCRQRVGSLVLLMSRFYQTGFLLPEWKFICVYRCIVWRLGKTYWETQITCSQNLGVLLTSPCIKPNRLLNFGKRGWVPQLPIPIDQDFSIASTTHFGFSTSKMPIIWVLWLGQGWAPPGADSSFPKTCAWDEWGALHTGGAFLFYRYREC